MLQASLDVLDAGRSTVVEITGEPGIGKTRLLSELCRRAEARGHLVLGGRVAEFERTLPFGPFVAAFDDYLAARSDQDLGAVGSDELTELAGVFPALSRFGGEGPTLQAERYRSYRAVRSLLEALSNRRPLVVALDDLQWADTASGELLGHLLRSPPRTPVMLALAARTAQLATPLSATLERVARDVTINRMELAALSPAEADMLLSPELDPVVRAELHRLSGGNPFYLEQLGRASRAGADGPRGTEGPLPAVPEAVQAALAGEIRGVTPAARRLLDGGAVVGDPFDLDLAADVAELAPSEALVALDHLTAAELLHPTESPRQFRFRHPLLRHAVYESTGAGWRLAAHARAAARMVGKATIASRALHIERSASVGDVDAVTTLTDAGRAAKEPFTAARWFGAALRLLPLDDEETPRRLELMAARIDALSASGQLTECHEALLEIIPLLPPGPAQSRQVAACACVEHLLGRLPEARRRLEQALRRVANAKSAEAVNLQIELCGNALLRCDAAQALPVASSALATARQLEDRLLMAVTGAMRLQAEFFTTGGNVGEQEMARVVDLVDSLDDAEFARRPDSAVWLGGVEFHLERFDDALRHLERVVDVSQATRQGHLLNASRIFQARAATSLGRLADAHQLADAASAAARLTANPRVTCRALAIESAVANVRGDAERALSSAEESYELVPALEPGELRALAGWALGTALLATGQAERAGSVLRQSGGGDDMALVGVAERCAFYEALAEVELAQGDRAAAEAWATRAAAAAATLPLALPAVSAGRARAALLLAGGDAEGAVGRALEAADLADGVGARIHSASSRLLAGRALAVAGRRERAVDQLREAERVFTECGADGHRAAAARELRRLGRRVGPRRRDAGSSSGLSAREMEIVQLLVENRTNREIAAGLYISEKTVESHLSHIYTKLGVSSRRVVARKFAALSGPPTESP